MILMPQIFDVIADENARYKRNELEFIFDMHTLLIIPFQMKLRSVGTL